jgi:hypothetical protein
VSSSVLRTMSSGGARKDDGGELSARTRSSCGAREEVVRRELGRSWRRHLLGSRSTGELQHLPQATHLDLNRKKQIGYLIPLAGLQFSPTSWVIYLIVTAMIQLWNYHKTSALGVPVFKQEKKGTWVWRPLPWRANYQHCLLSIIPSYQMRD